MERISEEIAPYDRFVCTEQARISEARAAFDELNAEVDALKQEIAAPGAQSGGMVSLEDSSPALKESSFRADNDIRIVSLKALRAEGGTGLRQ